MNRGFAIVIIVLVSLLSCKVEPEPLRFGEDACHACKMTLMDKKFGAEIVTAKGKVYKFDDLNCMVNFLDSDDVQERDMAYRLVIDFSHPEKLIAAEDAFYLKSDKVKSPMASQIAAFESKENMESHKKEMKGIYLTWGELVTQFK